MITQVDFELSISSGNDAVVTDTHDAIGEILHKLAERIGDGDTDGNIYDLNGNTVGHFCLTLEDDND